LEKEPGYLRTAKFRSLSEYRSFFPIKHTLQADQQTGEATTHYFYDSGIPKLINDVLPDLKLIFIYRDPASRAISQYYHFRSLGREKRPPEKVFANLLSLYREKFDGKCLPEVTPDIAASDYLKYGLYDLFFPAWKSFFLEKRLRVFSFEEIIQSPLQQMERLTEFLQIETVNTTFPGAKRGPYRSDAPQLIAELSKFYSPSYKTFLNQIEKNCRN